MTTALPQSGFSRFAEIVARHVRELEQANPQPGSAEKYLLNYLQELNKNVLSSSSAREVANCVRSLAHFAVDSLWNSQYSQLEKRVDEILTFHAALLKAEGR